MLRDIFSNKGVLIGIFFCILMVAGSLFYSWHVERGIREDAARIRRFLQRIETNKATRMPQQTGAETGVDTPGQTAETAVEPGDLSSTDTVVPTRLAIDTEGPVDTAAALIPEETGDVPVSPYGFGPYPELPEEWAGAFPPNSVKHELMVRVAVKLREQGVNVEGTSMEEGRVYPHIRGIYYVKWAETDEGVRYIANGTGHPYDGNRLHAIRVEKEEPLTEADIPADIKLVSYEEGGIDPYEFLGLHR